MKISWKSVVSEICRNRIPCPVKIIGESILWLKQFQDLAEFKRITPLHRIQVFRTVHMTVHITGFDRDLDLEKAHWLIPAVEKGSMESWRFFGGCLFTG